MNYDFIQKKIAVTKYMYYTVDIQDTSFDDARNSDRTNLSLNDKESSVTNVNHEF